MLTVHPSIYQSIHLQYPLYQGRRVAGADPATAGPKQGSAGTGQQSVAGHVYNHSKTHSDDTWHFSDGGHL